MCRSLSGDSRATSSSLMSWPSARSWATVGQVGSPESLVGEVAESRGEAEAKHLVQGEGHVGVRGVVGRDHLRLHPAVEVQQGVQRVEAVARGATYDHCADARDLVVDGVEPGARAWLEARSTGSPAMKTIPRDVLRDLPVALPDLHTRVPSPR